MTTSLRVFTTAILLTVSPAMAQDIVPTSPATFINTVLGLALGLLTTVLLPLAYLKGKQLITEQKLKNSQLEEQLRGTIDSGAQKAIGGALSKIEIPEGKLSGTVKDGVVKEATAALVKNFPDTFEALGVANVSSKAKEIVESRLGLMDAQAAGNPVPNTSLPLALAGPSTQNVTVTPAKK